MAAPRTRASARRAALVPFLSELRDDEIEAIGYLLADPLAPRLAVALSSCSRGLRRVQLRGEGAVRGTPRAHRHRRRVEARRPRGVGLGARRHATERSHTVAACGCMQPLGVDPEARARAATPAVEAEIAKRYEDLAL